MLRHIPLLTEFYFCYLNFLIFSNSLLHGAFILNYNLSKGINYSGKLIFRIAIGSIQ